MLVDFAFNTSFNFNGWKGLPDELQVLPLLAQFLFQRFASSITLHAQFHHILQAKMYAIASPGTPETPRKSDQELQVNNVKHTVFQ